MKKCFYRGTHPECVFVSGVMVPDNKSKMPDGSHLTFREMLMSHYVSSAVKNCPVKFMVAMVAYS